MTAYNLIHYKDFTAAIDFSSADNCWFGEVKIGDGRLIFSGISIEELHKHMAEAVEGHLVNLKKLS